MAKGERELEPAVLFMATAQLLMGATAGGTESSLLLLMSWA